LKIFVKVEKISNIL